MQYHRHLSTASRRLLLLPLLLLVALVAAGARSDVAARQPADQRAAARRLEENGEWEAAEQRYQAAIQDPGEGGQAARLELARLYERWGRYGVAAEQLEALLTDPAFPPSLLARAHFQYGSVLQALGRAEPSVAAYRQAIELGSPAAAYARVESAKILLAEGHAEAALAFLGPLLAGEGPENARRVALRLGARAMEDLGPAFAGEALAHHRAHAVLASSANERVPSLWKIATLERARGNISAAADAFLEIVTRYPGQGEAVDALEALGRLGRPASTLQAALVHYRRQNDATARRLYNEVLASGAPAADRAVALFYLGALAERRDEPHLAIENYGESYAADPGGRLAAEALWSRAVVLEEVADLGAAQAEYTRLAERHGASARAPEAAFRAGYIAYEGGRVQDARARWSAFMRVERSDVAAIAAFWAGHAAAELGDQEGARAAYAEAARRDPTGYYGLRAAAVFAGQPQAPRNGPFTLRLPVADWSEAETWLAGWAGAEPVAAWQAFAASEDWQATWEIAEAGWYKIALDAFVALLGRRADQPWLQYRAGRVLDEHGFPRAAYSAGFYITASAPQGSAVPSAIRRLSYPAPWSDVVQRFADRYGLDPLLFYAMMRQESAFDPEAGSSAGAFGLTQVIAPTAMDIASALGRSGTRLSDLARPALAIEFGAYYLAAQIRAVGGVAAGLGAYNGGRTNAERWQREAGSFTDVDRFQEEIDFGETETYIRLVIENYAWYRYLYGAADQPSIVR